MVFRYNKCRVSWMDVRSDTQAASTDRPTRRELLPAHTALVPSTTNLSFLYGYIPGYLPGYVPVRALAYGLRFLT